MASNGECAQGDLEVYDLPLHIGAVFIIMFASFSGTMLPIIAKRFPFLRIRDLPFDCAKMFGTGVILATALVHMLVPANENLSSPCLPAVFSSEYPAFSGALCLLGILFTHLLQFFVMRHVRKQFEEGVELPKIPDTTKPMKPEHCESQKKEHHHSHSHGDHDDHAHTLMLTKERHVSTYILELGIASHSIIVGIAIGVSRGTEFHSLLIALSFHQFFEGIALSTVVLDSDFSRKLVSVIMVLFYSFTTPFGIALGIGINQAFNGNSVGNLIAQGTLDAFSAGILLYDALINIIAVHFKQAKFNKSPTWHQLLHIFFMWFGAFIMALIGRWA